MSETKTMWLVTLTTGHYSDTHVQFLRIFEEEHTARWAAQLAAENLDRVRARHRDALDERRWDWGDITASERAALLLHPEGYVSCYLGENDPRYEVHPVPAGTLPEVVCDEVRSAARRRRT